MKNPVIPYAIIAGLGVLVVILVSLLGVNQRTDIQKAENGEPTEEQADEQAGETEDPEEMFSNNCASCHGADLSGGVGPNLQQVEDDHSAEDVKEIILNGNGEMPPIDVEDDQAEEIAEWLLEQ